MATVATVYEAATNAQREALKAAVLRAGIVFNKSQTGGIESTSHQFNLDVDAAAVAALTALTDAGYTA